MLIVKYRSVLVESDNVAVGHLIFIVFASSQVGEVNFILATALIESFTSGMVTEQGSFIGLLDAVNFVSRFLGSRKVQVIEQGCGVGLLSGQRLKFTRTNPSMVAELRKIRQLVKIVDDFDLEELGPFSLTVIGCFVPVIGRLIEVNGGFFTAVDVQQAVARFGQRNPPSKVRIGHMRWRHIVQKMIGRVSGINP